MLQISYLWATKIIEGDREYSEVPAKLKAEVAQILAEKGRPDLVTD